MKVTVYSKPRCVQCNATYKWLDKSGVKYEIVNLPDFPEKLDEFMAQGVGSAPVVVINDNEPFGGFRPDLLQKYILGIEGRPSDLYGTSGL